jgi:hypothetical protein
MFENGGFASSFESPVRCATLLSYMETNDTILELLTAIETYL